MSLTSKHKLKAEGKQPTEKLIAPAKLHKLHSFSIELALFKTQSLRCFLTSQATRDYQRVQSLVQLFRIPLDCFARPCCERTGSIAFASLLNIEDELYFVPNSIAFVSLKPMFPIIDCFSSFNGVHGNTATWAMYINTFFFAKFKTYGFWNYTKLQLKVDFPVMSSLQWHNPIHKAG